MKLLSQMDFRSNKVKEVRLKKRKEKGVDYIEQRSQKTSFD